MFRPEVNTAPRADIASAECLVRSVGRNAAFRSTVRPGLACFDVA
jgi:hypothetical protein